MLLSSCWKTAERQRAINSQGFFKTVRVRDGVGESEAEEAWRMGGEAQPIGRSSSNKREP